jgi:2-keto-4-pentenoate hydratase/2-oxohepta-3-ene-1,7-dioic acid hydratase in catechol pathway
MRLLTFHRNRTTRAGAAVGDFVVDLQRAARVLASGALPSSLRRILEGGEPIMARVRKTIRRAEARLRRVAEKRSRRPLWAAPLAEIELAPPIPDPEKIICIGQNYADHCREQGVPLPSSPIIFTKFPTTLTGPFSPVHLPPEDVTRLVDYEVELAFVIGREARRVREKDAAGYVAGYMIMNDVTGRDAQKSDGQWVRGKSFDTFGPCGPWIVTPDELGDPNDLPIWFKLNGELMQNSSTSNLIFKIPYLIEYLSRGLTFRPGDIVSTGTPPGVGIFRKPPVLLKSGDVMEAGIDGIGTIQNKCVRDRG